MKRFSTLTIVLLLTWTAAVSASADTIQSFQGTLGTGKTGQGTKLDLLQKTSDTQGSKSMRVERQVWLLPRGAVINVRAAGFCSLKQLQASGVCPSRSKIGTGKVKMDVRAGPFNQVDGEVTAYNAKPGRPGRGKVGRLFLQVNDPQSGNKTVLVGRISNIGAADPYGYQIRFDEMPSPPFAQGTNVVYSELSVSLEAQKKKRTKTEGLQTYSYVTTPPNCDGRWYFQGEFRIESQVLLTSAGSMECAGQGRDR